MHHSESSERFLSPALLGLMWTAMFGFSAFFLTYSTTVTVGMGQGLGQVTAGAALTTMMIAVIAVQPFAPALRLRFGPRAVILAALALQAAAQVIALVIPAPLPALLASGLAGGAGFGILVVVATAAVPGLTRPDRVGRALGAFGAVTSAAAAVGAPAGLWLVGEVPLWSFRLIACALLVVAVPTALRMPAVAAGARGGEEKETAGGAPKRIDLSVVVLLVPFLLSMTVFGLVLAFGPPAEVAVPALFIAAMQWSSVAGRLVSGALADGADPAGVHTVGVCSIVTGLVVATIAAPGWQLVAAMIVLGAGIGTVQSTSLIIAFARSADAGRGSVMWNMSFDIGLGLAGLFGGVGFTLLGADGTYLLGAALVLAAGIVFAIVVRRRA